MILSSSLVISVDKLVDYIEGTTDMFPSSLPPQEHRYVISVMIGQRYWHYIAL